MRWSIRYQLLVPLLTLLLGVVGISAWTAAASANRAWRQLETRVRQVAGTLSEAHFPLTPNVLELMKGLSGAEYLLLESTGRVTATLPVDAARLPAGGTVAEDRQALHLGAPVTIAGTRYLCSGVRLRPPRAATAGTLYILYPEALWRDTRWEAVRPSLVLGGFAGLASLVLALGVGQRLGRRIQALERRTRQIAAGDFRPMPLSGRDDELRDLGRSVNDMTGRLAQLQEAVQKNERLRLLGQVSAGLAHQLRNGVTGAILAVQLHARSCAGGDAEALDVALRQLALLEANLKRFLDLGRTEAPRREPCDLAALVEETVALLRPQCRHTRVELRWQPPDAPLTVAGDSGQLGHLLLNLLGNAVEAAGPGGCVEVRVRKAEVRRQRAEGRGQKTEGQGSGSEVAAAGATGADFLPPSDLRPLTSDLCFLEVIDSGPGPPPNVAERLFEPFLTSKAGGVGLGLAVARQVAEAHGGRINWRREAGRTCFQVALPMTGPGEAA